MHQSCTRVRVGQWGSHRVVRRGVLGSVRSDVWDAFGRAGEVAALAARRSRAPSASSEQCVRAAAVPQSSPVRGATRSQPRS